MSARYVMIGGFLGAGKTTAVAKLAEWLRAQGRTVGLITNDQGSQLVDSLTLRARGFPVEEIAGGCFCCRFTSLKDAADRLTASTRPDTFIAEPVGSCTDLVATVTYPLRRLYGDDFTVAPLSVVIDPLRAARILGLVADSDGKRFSDKVVYIYLKQLEEADVIVINKRDLIDAALLAQLDAALTTRFPAARRFSVSARSGDGLEAWFRHITGVQQAPGMAMSVDYDRYADGEALLGWFNATVAVCADDAADADGNRLVTMLMLAVQRRLTAAGAEIAHLKMTLAPDDGSGEIATSNLVRWSVGRTKKIAARVSPKVIAPPASLRINAVPRVSSRQDGSRTMLRTTIQSSPMDAIEEKTKTNAVA